MWSSPHWCQTLPSTPRPLTFFATGWRRRRYRQSRHAISHHWGGSGCPTISLMDSGRDWSVGLQMTTRLARYTTYSCIMYSLLSSRNIAKLGVKCIEALVWFALECTWHQFLYLHVTECSKCTCTYILCTYIIIICTLYIVHPQLLTNFI